MTWASFYLLCFVVGFLLSILSLLMGMFHIHLPGGHTLDFGGHGGDAGAGHGHAGGGHGHHLHVHFGAADAGAVSISPFNTFTVMAFLAWFGGAGYLMTEWGMWSFAALGFAVVAGVVGSTLVFLYLTRILLRHDSTMNESDYRMEGVLGRVSGTIREGGTGEIMYSQDGARKACGARSESGKPIEKGAEVVVTRYEKGIAYVQLWDELAGEAISHQGHEGITKDTKTSN